MERRTWVVPWHCHWTAAALVWKHVLARRINMGTAMECFSTLGRHHLVVHNYTTHRRSNCQEHSQIFRHRARRINRSGELVDTAKGMVHVIDRRIGHLCDVCGGADCKKGTIWHYTLWSNIPHRVHGRSRSRKCESAGPEGSNDTNIRNHLRHYDRASYQYHSSRKCCRKDTYKHCNFVRKAGEGCSPVFGACSPRGHNPSTHEPGKSSGSV
mmetsp:Transcript_655/g.4331  ORF Transcript_655/g.4331 Transcript_655/m.4331 type:complete len:212 (+) Transcript_655:415-1050(+)